MALAPQQFCVRWNSYHSNLQTVFPKLLSTENFADVTLACENRQLRCHKVVLSACSAYFERLLVQNPCKHPIIFMKDMRFSEMQSLVDFMYKGEVNVTQDELPSLLKSAEALQIRGLCSGEAGGAEAAPAAKGTQTGDGRDYTLASEALLRTQLDCAEAGNGAPPRQPERANGPCGKRRRAEPAPSAPTVKEETVEEDGLFYGELDNDDAEYNEDEETEKAGSSIGQATASAQASIRVKPESKLFLPEKASQSKSDSDYLTRLSRMNAYEIQSEFAKYGFTTSLNPEDNAPKKDPPKSKTDDNDFYKSWLEQNGELEVSLLRVSDKLRKRTADIETNKFMSEIELIPKTKTKSLLEKTLTTNAKNNCSTPEPKLPELSKSVHPQMKKFGRRGRPPLFKDKYFDIGGSPLKADLDQFLEGKEISSSGLSRKDLERVMMGKFNPNRRYSNEAMWAALMDVKKGGSIYRAAQTHKVPRKSLRNWMKRCHIKSSFPMPQQLKQFVENNKRQKETIHGFADFQGTSEVAHGKSPETGSDMYPRSDTAHDIAHFTESGDMAPNFTDQRSGDMVPFAERNDMYQSGDTYQSKVLPADMYQMEAGFGKHFLTFTSSNTVSSDEEMGLVVAEGEIAKDVKVGLMEGASLDLNESSDAILNMSLRN